jgi:hypothetical protein
MIYVAREFGIIIPLVREFVQTMHLKHSKYTHDNQKRYHKPKTEVKFGTYLHVFKPDFL